MTRKKTIAPLLLAGCIIGQGLMIPASAAAQADWDKDGISDARETSLGSEPYLSDTDGDGIKDGEEIGNPAHPMDTDNDGRLNVIDPDDDNDGIPSVIEGHDDHDGDGMPDYLDTDSDGDGLPDGHEVRLSHEDRDEDGIDDIFDSDISGDADHNGDGIVDIFVLHDTDKDGKPDLFDGDGKTSIIAAHKKPENKAASAPTVKQDDQQTTGEGDHGAIAGTSGTDSRTSRQEKDEQSGPMTLTAATLPAAPKAPSRTVKYIEDNADGEKGNAYYGNGYFYCADSLKVVPGITRFMITPPDKAKIIRDAGKGDYKWEVSSPGVYALQFQIPNNMRIVSGRVKGRRIVKETDPAPLVLGAEENPGKKGYLLEAPAHQKYWYTSFEIKPGAPAIVNNNIPLSGGICDDK